VEEGLSEKRRVPMVKRKSALQALGFSSTVRYKKSSLRLQATQSARLILLQNNRVMRTIEVTENNKVTWTISHTNNRESRATS
jgi:hypothetical protein